MACRSCWVGGSLPREMRIPLYGPVAVRVRYKAALFGEQMQGRRLKRSSCFNIVVGNTWLRDRVDPGRLHECCLRNYDLRHPPAHLAVPIDFSRSFL